MRVKTITTAALRPETTAWRRTVTLVLALCSLAIAATASGYGPSAYGQTPDRVLGYGGSAESVVSDPTPGSPIVAGQSPDRVLAYGGSGEAPVSASTPASSPAGDGFDWLSAAVGAGAAMALAALGGAAVLTVRRRTATVSTS